MRFVSTTITAVIEAALLGAAILIGIPAHAEVTAQPALSHFHPLQPPPGAPTDARSEVQELLRQTSELDDQWNGLSQPQRNERLAALQQQATRVQNDVNNLSPDQKPEVQGMLTLAVIRLANILGKMRAAS
jgi:FtsZ-interacting cell division protein ZipA